MVRVIASHAERLFVPAQARVKQLFSAGEILLIGWPHWKRRVVPAQIANRRDASNRSA
jgi:hypothetical protein